MCAFFFDVKSIVHLKSGENVNLIELLFAIITTSASFLIIFSMCEFGEMVNNRFDLFDDELCECKWYTFPIELQKLLLTFMSNTQREAIIRGIGSTECNREAFKKVTSFVDVARFDGIMTPFVAFISDSQMWCFLLCGS